MRSKLFFSLLLCLSATLAACNRRAAPQVNSETKSTPAAADSGATKFDVCGLLKPEEIESVQGSPIKDMKNSGGQSSGGFQTAQCFFTATEFSRSVSLSVTRPASGSQRSSVRTFWKETFARAATQEKKHEAEGDREKRESLRDQRRERGEEEGAPLQKIEGVGEEAYWSGTRVGGALYVLKDDAFIRISLGGADTPEAKINKSKALAEKALGRL